jgi:uncharacterized membrane protein YidH (DUF202 family)
MDTKRILRALKETIFYCAAIHLVLLGIYVIMSGDWTFLSIASIFDMKLFFPAIDYASLTVVLVGLVPVIALFVWQYARAAKK